MIPGIVAFIVSFLNYTYICFGVILLYILNKKYKKISIILYLLFLIFLSFLINVNLDIHIIPLITSSLIVLNDMLIEKVNSKNTNFDLLVSLLFILSYFNIYILIFLTTMYFIYKIKENINILYIGIYLIVCILLFSIVILWKNIFNTPLNQVLFIIGLGLILFLGFLIRR